jgi:uncharacterized RDD family membrane protein YckC
VEQPDPAGQPAASPSWQNPIGGSGTVGQLTGALEGCVPAPLGKRAIAYIIDAVIQGVLSLPAYIGLILLIAQGEATAASTVLLVVGLILPLIYAIVAIALQGVKGYTPGMYPVGVRATRYSTGGKIGIVRSLGRYVLFAIIWWLMALSIMFDPAKVGRGFHDRATDSILVDIKDGRDPVGAATVAGARSESAPAVATGPVGDQAQGWDAPSAAQADAGAASNPWEQPAAPPAEPVAASAPQQWGSPAPAPEPAPEVASQQWGSPAPEPSAEPAPQQWGSPAQAPEPAPESAPEPASEQQQWGAPVAAPAPEPESEPRRQWGSPAPEPAPEPVPEPTPEPERQWSPPAPEPGPESAPEPIPEPASELEQRWGSPASAPAPGVTPAPQTWVPQAPNASAPEPQASAPEPVAPTPAPPAPAVPAEEDAWGGDTRLVSNDRDVEETRIVQAPERRTVKLVLDDGTEQSAQGPVVVGRNPEAADHETALVLRDQTRSVSKTHLRLTPTFDGVTVTDLGSTNGSAIVGRDGTRVPLTANEPVELPAGARVAVGDRTLTVEILP